MDFREFDKGLKTAIQKGIHARIFGPRRCLWMFAKNTGEDQPAHPRRLISAFVIRFVESIISKLATSKMSIF